MFKCEQCPSVFAVKRNLVAHQNKHAGVRFPCTACPLTFSYKTGLNKHTKNIHGIVNVPARLRPMTAAPITAQPVPAQQVQIAPQIFVPDAPAGGSNMLTEDEICMNAMDEFEDTG
ncbi:unnamed protein product [Macrosiphum euphorbiae]|uniref:C2H2-type domain-containing protein n=1 Tax=Macrosiphum euphorbiae TaxID=13131 RepID=A0AAV0WIQ3_9HEMI|nr:unnamed protein product [Macrosiphum euphorbiae]